VASLAVGLAAAAGYAVVGAGLVPDRAAWLVPVAVAAGAGALAAVVTVAFAVRPVHTAAVLSVCAIGLSPVLPRYALRLGRLPLPRVPTDVSAFRRDEQATLGPEVRRATQVAGEALTGLLAAVAGTVVVAAVVLLRSPGHWDWALAGLAGAVLVLRARAYLGVGQRLALLAAGVATATAAGVRAAVAAGMTGGLALLGGLALAGVGCAVWSVRATGRSASPYWSRALDVVEIVAMVALLPVCAAALDVYGAVRALAG
jgi:type VII secretion integral membrane protein EccD